MEAIIKESRSKNYWIWVSQKLIDVDSSDGWKTKAFMPDTLSWGGYFISSEQLKMGTFIEINKYIPKATGKCYLGVRFDLKNGGYEYRFRGEGKLEITGA